MTHNIKQKAGKGEKEPKRETHIHCSPANLFNIGNDEQRKKRGTSENTNQQKRRVWTYEHTT